MRSIASAKSSTNTARVSQSVKPAPLFHEPAGSAIEIWRSDLVALDCAGMLDRASPESGETGCNPCGSDALGLRCCTGVSFPTELSDQSYRIWNNLAQGICARILRGRRPVTRLTL